jgi:hypothetical protein
LAVFVDGVKQASIGGAGAYTLTGSVLNFTAAPPTNAIIEILHLGVQSLVNVPADATVTASALAPELRTILADQFTANGTGTTFTLTYPPISSNSVIVTANGVVQYDYSVSGSTLILNFTPADGTIIRAAGMGNILTLGTITDDSVSTAKLQTNAVTGAKIASGTITVDKVAFGTVLDAANSGSSYANSAFATANSRVSTSNTNTFTANQTFAVANITNQLTVSGIAYQNIITLTDGATITPNLAQGQNFEVTLGGSRALASPTNITPGQSGYIIVKQDGTGSRTLSYGSSWRFPGNTAPTLTTTASAVDLIVYTARDSSNLIAQAILNVT